MIQSSPPLSPTALGVPGEGAAIPAADAVEGLNFSALLALQVPVPTQPVGTIMPSPAPALLPGQTATAPASSGNFLPLDLPSAPVQALPTTEALAAAPQMSAAPAAILPIVSLPDDVSAEPDADSPVLSPQTAIRPGPAPKPLPRLARPQPGKTEARLARDPEAEAPSNPAEPAPVPADVFSTAPIVPEIPNSAARIAPPALHAGLAERPADTARDTLPTASDNSPPPQRTVPGLPRAASALVADQPAHGMPELDSQSHRTLSAMPPAAETPPKAVPPLAVPAEEVQVELVRPRLAAAAVASKELPRPLAPAAEATDPAAAFTIPAPAATAQAAPVDAGAITPIRHHDFAALIDRLSAAREALQPQAVSITVAHQDFGQVRLNFRQDDTGLSVAMASADPGFARAAAAAPAAVLPVTSADVATPGQSQTGQRADSGSTLPGNAGGHAQQRGGSPGQRGGEGQARHNPASRGSSPGSAPRHGIFA